MVVIGPLRHGAAGEAGRVGPRALGRPAHPRPGDRARARTTTRPPGSRRAGAAGSTQLGAAARLGGRDVGAGAPPATPPELLVGGSGRRSPGWRGTPTGTSTAAGRRGRSPARRRRRGRRGATRSGRARPSSGGRGTSRSAASDEAGARYLLDYYAFTGPFAGDRGRQPHLAARDQRLRPRVRGGGLRRAGAAADGGRHRPDRTPGRGAGVRVRIDVLGAGPAGLYFALLAKKADPGQEVTVVERNPPDATFGWGVVFSEETLGALRDADGPTYEEITDTFAKWTRSTSATAASRCARGGTRSPRSGASAAPHPAAPRAPSSASSCGSRRGRLADELPRGRPGGGRRRRQQRVRRTRAARVPAGARRPPHPVRVVRHRPCSRAFTFIFRETEHGLFQVHAYPFDAETSTFIVECPEATWRRAGLRRRRRASRSARSCSPRSWAATGCCRTVRCG